MLFLPKIKFFGHLTELILMRFDMFVCKECNKVQWVCTKGQKSFNIFKCPDKFIIGFMSSSLDIWKVHLILKKWDLFSIFYRLPFNKSPTMLKNPNGLHLDSWLWQHQKFCPDFELLTRLSAICNICWNFGTLNIILLPWIFFHMLLCVFE